MYSDDLPSTLGVLPMYGDDLPSTLGSSTYVWDTRAR